LARALPSLAAALFFRFTEQAGGYFYRVAFGGRTQPSKPALFGIFGQPAYDTALEGNYQPFVGEAQWVV
jgi:hypothetical protein